MSLGDCAYVATGFACGMSVLIAFLRWGDRRIADNVLHRSTRAAEEVRRFRLDAAAKMQLVVGCSRCGQPTEVPQAEFVEEPEL